MSFFDVLRIYFRYITRYRAMYVTFMVAVVCLGISTNLLPLCFKLFIQIFQSGSGNHYLPLLYILGILTMQSASLQATYYLHSRLYRLVTTDLTMDAVKNLQDQDYSYHTNKSSGKLIAVVSRGDRAMITLIDDLNNQVVTSIFDFCVPVLVIATFSHLVAVALTVVLILFAPVAYFLLKINVTRRRATYEPESQMTGIIVDNLVNFETVKSFAKERTELNRLRNAFRILNITTLHYLDSFRFVDVGLFFLDISLIGFGTWFGILEYTAGHLNLATFVTLLGYLFAYPNKLHSLFYTLRSIAKSMTDFVSFFELVQLKPSINDPVNPQDIPEPKGKIEFQNVTFAYQDSQNIRELSFTIQAGEEIALVGPSGAGKSTITKLLLRYYDPQIGNILIDGVDIRNLPQRRLRELVGIVPQDPIMFNASIFFNVAYALDTPDRAKVEEACRHAQIHDFITSLPQGYDTIVGERGIRLSGGQRQRLAIARMILKNPPILIFDEATSALDSESEQLIQKAFAELSRGKTSIIIAHRLSTIVNCDRIIVLEEGELKQVGSHHQLLEQPGLYKKLWEIQSGGFINPHHRKAVVSEYAPA